MKKSSLCDNSKCNKTTIFQKQMAPVKCSKCNSGTYCCQACLKEDEDHICNSDHLDLDNTTQINSSVNETLLQIQQKKRTLDDYEFINGDKGMLGRGAFGEVRLAIDIDLQQEMAIKILNKKKMLRNCNLQQLKNEIKLQRSLNHPNIIQLYHAFEDRENIYFALEYASNGSLYKYLRKLKVMPEPEAFVYFFQTCLAVDYLHKKNVIHRDLKPENILLDDQGNVKLCDFGWSAESVEMRSTFCGTFDYMAPEMLHNKPHDYRVDIWALGILLYELLHGNAPFTKAHFAKENIQNLNIKFSQSVSSQAKDLITQILQHDPKKRMSMNQIFAHQWLQSNAEEFGMDISEYIYVPKSQRINDSSINQTFEQSKQLNESKIKQNNNTNTSQIKKPDFLNTSQQQQSYQKQEVQKIQQNSQENKKITNNNSFHQTNNQSLHQTNNQSHISKISENLQDSVRSSSDCSDIQSRASNIRQSFAKDLSMKGLSQNNNSFHTQENKHLFTNDANILNQEQIERLLRQQLKSAETKSDDIKLSLNSFQNIQSNQLQNKSQSSILVDDNKNFSQQLYSNQSNTVKQRHVQFLSPKESMNETSQKIQQQVEESPYFNPAQIRESIADDEVKEKFSFGSLSNSKHDQNQQEIQQPEEQQGFNKKDKILKETRLSKLSVIESDESECKSDGEDQRNYQLQQITQAVRSYSANTIQPKDTKNSRNPQEIELQSQFLYQNNVLQDTKSQTSKTSKKSKLSKQSKQSTNTKVNSEQSRAQQQLIMQKKKYSQNMVDYRNFNMKEISKEDRNRYQDYKDSTKQLEIRSRELQAYLYSQDNQFSSRRSIKQNNASKEELGFFGKIQLAFGCLGQR
ncbi:unnamed protein product [Paramecium primaurelia]|uniref:Aurora kinase n=1 Tax=Paramecium primaurelia TaxID=5886 RepID=A0A8S1N1T5_PARPR|nr:unnamed protein product [Paramecium primaurelia]